MSKIWMGGSLYFSMTGTDRQTDRTFLLYIDFYTLLFSKVGEMTKVVAEKNVYDQTKIQGQYT